MPPVPRERAPSPAAQELLLKHLAELRSDLVRDLMRENGIKGLSSTKDHLIELVKNELRDRRLSWDTLIAFLDRQEPNGKQRVLMYQAPVAQKDSYSVAALNDALEQAGHGELWNATVPIAAPEELELSSVRADDRGQVEILAIGRRRYRHRVRELEDQVAPPKAGMEVQLYEWVDVRAWVRADLSTDTGALNLRAVLLPQDKVQRELFEDFVALISDWFPMDLFQPLDLRKAIKALHDDECAGGAYSEARVQQVGYDDASGRKATIRSASASQSVNGAPPSYQAAIDAVRASGEGSDGNFYFLPTAGGGPPGCPIGKDPVRVIIKAGRGRLDFTKPHHRAELAHVLHRIRVLAT